MLHQLKSLNFDESSRHLIELFLSSKENFEHTSPPMNLNGPPYSFSAFLNKYSPASKQSSGPFGNGFSGASLYPTEMAAKSPKSAYSCSCVSVDLSSPSTHPPPWICMNTPLHFFLSASVVREEGYSTRQGISLPGSRDATVKLTP